MKPRLIIRPAALADLEDIAAWIGADSPASAARFLEQCMSEFQQLASMPHMGRSRHFSNSRAAGIRSWIIKGFPNHMIFYRPVEQGVEVLHILHGARDIDAIFED
jgi:toxin ParE1/3/4